MISESRAREISAYYQTPRNSFSVFASTGTITEDFLGEIRLESLLYPQFSLERVELDKLYDYIEATEEV